MKSSSFEMWFWLQESPKVTGSQVWVTGGCSIRVMQCFPPKKPCRRYEEWAVTLSKCSSKSPFATTFFIPHLSSGQEMWYCNSYQLSGLVKQTHSWSRTTPSLSKTTVNMAFTLLQLSCAIFGMVTQASAIGKIRLLFQGHSHKPLAHLPVSYTHLSYSMLGEYGGWRIRVIFVQVEK